MRWLRALATTTMMMMMMMMLATAGVARAQDAVAAAPPATAQIETPSRPHGRVADAKFWALGGGLVSSMLMDTKSTFDVSVRCPDCIEANPFVAPFVNRGPKPTYIAGLAFDAGVMVVAAKMKGSEHAWARHTWWAIPGALIAGHAIAYRHNVNLAR